MKLLFVDDSQDILELMCIVFEPEGYEVKTASDGAQAVETLKTYRPDLIFVDYQMEGMNGLAFLKAIKPLGIPCILLTGMPEPDIPLGDYVVLTKSVGVDQLLSVVQGYRG